MKAWLLDSLTGIQTLRLADVPIPTPGPREVVLKVQFAALNPADYYLAQGHYPAKPAFPHILGRDGSGTVTAVGSAVSSAKVGDTRTILRGDTGVSRPGTLAEYVVVAEDELVEIPAGWSTQQAAAAPLVYLTAYQAIRQWSDLAPGTVVLITGASGGVGVATIHLAAALGYQPVGLSRDEAKWPKLEAEGAKLMVSPADAGWRDKLYARFGKRPVGLVIDNVAGPGFPEVIDTLKQNARVSLIGALAGPVPSFNTASLFFRRIRLGGTAVGTYTAAEAQTAWRDITSLLTSAKRKPLIDSTHAFSQAPAAFARLQAGVLGKVLVQAPQ